MNPHSAPATDASRPSKGARSVETESAIVEAARNIVAEGGYPTLSMRSVADRVGLTATAIYHYFDSKDELVTRVVQSGYHRFGEYFSQAADQHPVGSLERLLALGDAYVRFALENQEYFRVLYNIQARPREVQELPGGGGYDLLRGCVVEAMEAGNLREGNPDLIAHYLWTSVHGLVTLALACNIECAECRGLGDDPQVAANLYRDFMPFLADGLRPSNETSDAGGAGKRVE